MEERTFLGQRGLRLTAIIVFIAGAEFLLFGYDQGVVGGLINLPSFTDTFPMICTTAACLEGTTAAERDNRSTTQGIVVACYNLGCLLGAMSTFKLGNILGRRTPIFLGCIIVSIGAILEAAAFDLPTFIVGRVICGIGTGLNTATMPVWQAECTKPHQRGPIMAFETSLVPAGVMISYWVDFGFSYAEPSQVAWRFPIAFQLVFALLVMAFIFFLPESPRWLVLKGRRDEAAQVLSALYDVPEEDSAIRENLSAIDAAIEGEVSTDWAAPFREGPTRARTRTLMAVSIQVMSQFSGTNVVNFYATSIFQNEIGLSPFISRILSGCLGTVSFISAMGSPFLIKNVGRRRVAMVNLGGMGSSMLALAVAGSFKGYGAGIASAVFVFTFIVFFSVGFAQIPWIYPAEITPIATRVQANALSTATNWVGVFIVVMITPIAFNNIGWRTYLIFGCCNLFAMAVIYFCFPETRNRSLEEIELIFSDSSGLFGAVKQAKITRCHFNAKGEPVKSLVADFQHVEDA
ncbi:sugar transport protein [Aspergillus pseudoustus]|uniref:Sugar transport protein n=1 Tax=Aspergillus pseudoustus TaxID=1810923 RepID=A0ABR4J6I7_9EURO